MSFLWTTEFDFILARIFKLNTKGSRKPGKCVPHRANAFNWVISIGAPRITICRLRPSSLETRIKMFYWPFSFLFHNRLRQSFMYARTLNINRSRYYNATFLSLGTSRAMETTDTVANGNCVSLYMLYARRCVLMHAVKIWRIESLPGTVRRFPKPNASVLG